MGVIEVVNIHDVTYDLDVGDVIDAIDLFSVNHVSGVVDVI
jgi:hypothetical protein